MLSYDQYDGKLSKNLSQHHTLLLSISIYLHFIILKLYDKNIENTTYIKITYINGTNSQTFNKQPYIMIKYQHYISMYF